MANMQDKKEDILKELTESEKEKQTMFEQMQLMMTQMKAMEEKLNSQPQTIIATPQKEKVKSVRLMSLSMGQCHLSDGILNAKFKKAFDQIPMRETIFQDFFYRFKQWFEDLEVIILDDDFAEEYGMKIIYDQYGISETFMNEMLTLNAENMIARLSVLPPKLQMVFVKFFAEQVKNSNENSADVQKHYALEAFIKEKFGFEINIKEISEQFVI